MCRVGAPWALPASVSCLGVQNAILRTLACIYSGLCVQFSLCVVLEAKEGYINSQHQ